jgi:predicted lipoprotein with Yx(FWY)xxD motif
MRPTEEDMTIVDRTSVLDAGSGPGTTPRVRWRLARTRPLALGGALFAVAIAAAACGMSGGSTSAAGAAPTGAPAALASITTTKGTVHTARVKGVGVVLVNASGRTLYLFGPDNQKKVTCTGMCADAWPPLYVKGKPKPGSGIKDSLLGTIKAPNGKTQVTYNHWPLYTFSGDTKSGQANGEGLRAFGGVWFAVNKDGHRARPTSSTAPTSTTTTTAPW